MKTFKKMAAQGDVLFFKVDKLPDNVKEVKPEEGKYVVAHSETGHHHTVEALPPVQFFSTPDPNVSYMKINRVKGFSLKKTPIKIMHERDFDTHETLGFTQVGIYQVNRQREYTPEGWQTVLD